MGPQERLAKLLTRRRLILPLLLLALLILASLPNHVAAVDRRYAVPSTLERSMGRKSKPDIPQHIRVEPTPFLAVECAWYNLVCLLSPCKRWGGEIEEATQAKVDIASRVGRILHQGLVGQELAISHITSALRSKRDKSPLSMHFVGDNGTGKTLAATLLQRALFVDQHPKGVLYLRGNSYIAFESAATANYRNELFQKIDHQLKVCPQSLIIIDEVQLMHRNTILVFEQFLDDTFVVDHTARGGADPRGATFVFISDFGKEGMSAIDTPDELIRRAHNESLEIWKGGRTSSLIQHIIPFMPATPVGAFELISELTQELFIHPWFERNHLAVNGIFVCDKDQLLNGLTKYVWDKQQNSATQLEQYRGLKKTFENQVTRQLLESADQLARSKKLNTVPRTEAPVPIRIQLCTNGGVTLDIAAQQYWRNEVEEEAKEKQKEQTDIPFLPDEPLKTDL